MFINIKSGRRSDIRDLRLVNLALLEKWRWRFIMGGEAIGNIWSKPNMLKGLSRSSWWTMGLRGVLNLCNNISLMGTGQWKSTKWLSNSIFGNDGRSTNLLIDPWLRVIFLRICFLRLFQVSIHKEAKDIYMTMR